MEELVCILIAMMTEASDYQEDELVQAAIAHVRGSCFCLSMVNNGNSAV